MFEFELDPKDVKELAKRCKALAKSYCAFNLPITDIHHYAMRLAKEFVYLNYNEGYLPHFEQCAFSEADETYIKSQIDKGVDEYWDKH